MERPVEGHGVIGDEVALFVREGVTVMVGPGVRVDVWVKKMTGNGVAVGFLVPGLSMMIGSAALPLEEVGRDGDFVFVAAEPAPGDELDDGLEEGVDDGFGLPCPAVATKTGESDVPIGSEGSADSVTVSAVEIPGSVPIKRYLKGVAVSGAGAGFRLALNRPSNNTTIMPNRETTPSRIGNKIERSEVGLGSGSEFIRFILPPSG